MLTSPTCAHCALALPPEEDLRFCPGCGQPVQPAATVVSPAVVPFAAVKATAVLGAPPRELLEADARAAGRDTLLMDAPSAVPQEEEDTAPTQAMDAIRGADLEEHELDLEGRGGTIPMSSLEPGGDEEDTLATQALDRPPVHEPPREEERDLKPTERFSPATAGFSDTSVDISPVYAEDLEEGNHIISQALDREALKVAHLPTQALGSVSGQDHKKTALMAPATALVEPVQGPSARSTQIVDRDKPGAEGKLWLIALVVIFLAMVAAGVFLLLALERTMPEQPSMPPAGSQLAPPVEPPQEAPGKRPAQIAAQQGAAPPTSSASEPASAPPAPAPSLASAPATAPGAQQPAPEEGPEALQGLVEVSWFLPERSLELERAPAAAPSRRAGAWALVSLAGLDALVIPAQDPRAASARAQDTAQAIQRALLRHARAPGEVALQPCEEGLCLVWSDPQGQELRLLALDPEDSEALAVYQSGDLWMPLVRARHQARWLQVLLDLVARQTLAPGQMPPAQEQAAQRWLASGQPLGRRHRALSAQDQAALRQPAFLIQPWTLTRR